MPSNAVASTIVTPKLRWQWLLLFLVLAVLVTPWFGTEIITPSQLQDSAEWNIFVRFRLTRTILALIAGACLSVAGCLFQAVLRNPLAEPYTLGVSSGSALGAAAAIVFGFVSVGAGAMVGAMVALFIVAGVGLTQRQLSTNGLVLAGVSVSSVCFALIILLQSVVGFAKSFAITTWLIGGIEAPAQTPLAIYAAIALPLLAWVVWKAPEWDLLSLGETWAAGRGLAVRRLVWQACLVGCLLTAATVTFTGPIGFIGLMVPHVVRQLCGSGHRQLVPGSWVLGAAMLLVCDAVARTILRPAEIPVGVVTALLGGPGLIWILHSRRNPSQWQ